MVDIQPNEQWIQEQFTTISSWVTQNILSWDMVTQTCIMLVLFVAAHVFTKQSSQAIEHKLSQLSQKPFIRIHASYREIFFLVYAIGFLWVAVLTSEASQTPSAFLRTIASLTTAWGVIRFTSSTIESHFWSRFIALGLWALAALNIVGLLGETILLLDKMAFAVGEYKLSLLFIIKSIAALSILLWLMNLTSKGLKNAFSRSEKLNPSQRVLFFKLSNITLYVIAAIIGMNIVGIDLTALTVFSGALGLGIGFGLQKVFSNLISGIILLMDKSIKPGDVVAVGETYGWVNSLGARCISVITRDGKEHLIPNENLITQEVENWSYSNRRVRLHIPVGVSYNSDVHQVKEILLEAVSKSARILKNPAPTCLIKGFGDNSIDFELRAWIEDPQEGVSNIKSIMYFHIWDMFKENNIEIPFPQRDIHLKNDSFDKMQELMKNKA